MTQTIDTQGLEAVCKWLIERATVSCIDNQFHVNVPAGEPSLGAALEHWNVPIRPGEHGEISLRGIAAMDLMWSLMDSAELGHLFLGTTFERSVQLVSQRLPQVGQELPRGVQVQVIDERAIVPHKQRASDSGYDLTLIAERKQIGAVRLYGTGLIVEPPEGYYFDVVARSSIIKTGHMLANNVGIIDRAYRGELMVPVIKVDPDAAELELPIRLAQLVPRPIVHFPVSVTTSLTSTSRGTGGFGSSG